MAKPPEVIVDSRIRLRGLTNDDLESIRAVFTYSNPEYGRAARFGAGNVDRSIPKTVTTFRRENAAEVSVPRGGMQRVRELLAPGKQFPGTRVPGPADRRIYGEQLSLSAESMRTWLDNRRMRPLYTHQERIAEALLKHETALVRSPTNSGKTIAVANAIVRADKRALVMVPTLQLAHQWARDVGRELGIHVGFIGGGVCDIQPITVGLATSIANRIDDGALDLRRIGTFVVDEVQRAAADDFASVIDRIPARYRLGVSADERRADRREFLIRDAFGECAYEVKRADLIKAGVIVDVEIVMVPTSFDDPDFREAQAAADELAKRARAGERIGRSVSFHISRGLQQARLKLIERMSADPDRNQLVERLIRSIDRQGHTALVFTDRREHAKLLLEAVRNAAIFENVDNNNFVAGRYGLLLGGKADEKTFAATRAGIESGAITIGVGTYKALGVGINLPAVSRGICVTPMDKNKQQHGQVRGRLRARGSADAKLYVMWDGLVFGDAPLEAMRKWNKRVTVLGSTEVV